MSFGNYNNQNLPTYLKNQYVSNLGSGNQVNKTEQAEEVKNPSFDIFDIQERVNNKDFSVLNELSALGIKYDFIQNNEGHNLIFDYNGSHYEINYIEPNPAYN